MQEKKYIPLQIRSVSKLIEWRKSRNRVNGFAEMWIPSGHIHIKRKRIFNLPYTNCNDKSEKPFRTPQFLLRRTTSFSALWEQRSHSDRCLTAREMLQKNWWSFTADTLVYDSRLSKKVL